MPGKLAVWMVCRGVCIVPRRERPIIIKRWYGGTRGILWTEGLLCASQTAILSILDGTYGLKHPAAPSALPPETAAAAQHCPAARQAGETVAFLLDSWYWCNSARVPESLLMLLVRFVLCYCCLEHSCCCCSVLCHRRAAAAAAAASRSSSSSSSSSSRTRILSVLSVSSVWKPPHGQLCWPTASCPPASLV